MVKRHERRAVSLLEVLLAVALFAVLGLAVHQLMSTAAEGAARGSELQLATVMGNRVIDRLISGGFANLLAIARRGGEGAAGDLDLSAIGEPGDEQAPRPGELVADGFAYSAGFKLEEAGTGLVRLRVSLKWQRVGSPQAREPGSLALVRYVGDPLLSQQSNEPFGRSP